MYLLLLESLVFYLANLYIAVLDVLFLRLERRSTRYFSGAQPGVCVGGCVYRNEPWHSKWVWGRGEWERLPFSGSDEEHIYKMPVYFEDVFTYDLIHVLQSYLPLYMCAVNVFNRL